MMKKMIFLLLLAGMLLLALVGCGEDEKTEFPKLTYVVDGVVFYEDVLETEDEFFDEMGKIPQKTGYAFGGWFLDDGVWEQPLSYTDLNTREERSSVTVYAKWEVVALKCDEANRTYTVTGLLAGAGADVVIPENYKGLPVTKIADEAFRGNTTLQTVEIPTTITEIGNYAFAECTALKTVKLPHGVKTVGRNAFSNCIALTEARLSAAMKEIPAELFRGCSALTTVNIPTHTKKIQARAFYGCTVLSEITLPVGITNLGLEIFYGTSITTLNYGGNATKWSKISRDGYNTGSKITTVKLENGDEVEP